MRRPNNPNDAGNGGPREYSETTCPTCGEPTTTPARHIPTCDGGGE